jgi:hypothetical protein
LTITAPGVPFSSRIVAITGDRLIHPHDLPSDIARIVLRWGPRWLPHTGTARQYFAARGFTDDEPSYRNHDVTGWLLLPPQPGSLAEQVRSGHLDIATALSAEALAWPSKDTTPDLESTPSGG